MHVNATVAIPTKNRYESLKQTLLSIALQTYKPKEVFVVDDSDTPIDVRQLPGYPEIFELFIQMQVEWRVIWGKKMGQHISHQIVQDNAQGDWIFRIDDDCIAEENVLELLWKKITPQVGAIAPAVLMPNPQVLPKGLKNIITDLNAPNVQWFRSKGMHEADHLYSCFLYRKGIIRYETALSPVSHREETFFTYKLKLAGKKLLINSDAVVWHFRKQEGGIRAGSHPAMWEHDEKLFNEFLKEEGVKKINKKMVVLNGGLGDHFAFKNILPELKTKYKKIVIAASFPDAFFDIKGVEIISIAEAQLLGDTQQYDIYRKMIDWNWKGSLMDAFKKLYL